MSRCVALPDAGAAFRVNLDHLRPPTRIVWIPHRMETNWAVGPLWLRRSQLRPQQARMSDSASSLFERDPWSARCIPKASMTCPFDVFRLQGLGEQPR